jgi:hypothetical protein
MSKRSAAALSVVATHPRPEPPGDLSEQQRATWVAVVATKPADWFGADSFPLLVAYCKAIEVYGVIAAQVETFDAEWMLTPEGLNRYDKLTKILDRQAKQLSSLATKMRLSQQSRMSERKAETAHQKNGGERKPWEKARAVN